MGGGRKKQLREFASQQRWRYVKEDQKAWWDFDLHSPPFNTGFAKTALNVLSGRHDRHRATAFDYQYQWGNGRAIHTNGYRVLCVDLPKALPTLYVTPRPDPSKHRRPEQPEPEYPTGDSAFDARFVVTGDAGLARDLLSADVVRLLMTWPDIKWRVEKRGLVAWDGSRLRPDWIAPTLDMLCALADAIPEAVWQSAR